MPIAFPPPNQGNIFNDFPLRYRKPFAVVPVPKAVNQDRAFFTARAPGAAAVVNPVTSSIGRTRVTDRRVYDRVLGYPVVAGVSGWGPLLSSHRNRLVDGTVAVA